MRALFFVPIPNRQAFMMQSNFKKNSLRQRITARCMLLVLLLQVWIPIGYMPASLAADGSLLRLCPNGLSDELMMVLHPGHASHVGHAAHGLVPLAASESQEKTSHHNQASQDRPHHSPHHHNHAQHDSAKPDQTISDQTISDPTKREHVQISQEHHVSSEPHGSNASSWHNQCSYGSIAPSSALISKSIFIAAEIVPQQLRITLLPALSVLAERFRQQSPRAPPQSIS